MNKIKTEEHYSCVCDTPSHVLRFSHYVWDFNGIEEEELVVSMVLNSYLGFWQRLKVALKYIIGKEDRCLPYDTVVLNEQKAQQMKDFLEQYLTPNSKNKI